MIRIWRNQKQSHSKTRGAKRTDKTYRKPSEQLFSSMRPLSYPNLNMKMHIRWKKKHNNSTPYHKTIRTTTEVSHWNDQLLKYWGGGGSLTSFMVDLSTTLLKVAKFCSMLPNLKGHGETLVVETAVWPIPFLINLSLLFKDLISHPQFLQWFTTFR